MSEPTGGTWTFTIGGGTSDPVPWDADSAAAWRAYYQACERADVAADLREDSLIIRSEN